MFSKARTAIDWCEPYYPWQVRKKEKKAEQVSLRTNVDLIKRMFGHLTRVCPERKQKLEEQMLLLILLLLLLLLLLKKKKN